MRQLIAGNWKMNGRILEAVGFARAVREAAPGVDSDLLVCPPFTMLAAMAAVLAGSAVELGGQDCHAVPDGPHTGDISAAMLADAGCSAVILGHSERRQDHHENDALVRAKVVAATKAGLKPVVCVGETEAQRDAGDAEALVCRQVAASLPDGFAGVVAYEPIWAIGTGRTPTSKDVAAMHAAIRAALVRRLGAGGEAVRILYGGSVKPENAGSLLSIAEVGGALVGGASLNAESFLAIAHAVRRDGRAFATTGAVR